jgi:hypothetical protein
MVDTRVHSGTLGLTLWLFFGACLLCLPATRVDTLRKLRLVFLLGVVDSEKKIMTMTMTMTMTINKHASRATGSKGAEERRHVLRGFAFPEWM